MRSVELPSKAILAQMLGVAESLKNVSSSSGTTSPIDYDTLMMKLFAIAQGTDSRAHRPHALLEALCMHDAKHGTASFALQTLPRVIDAAASVYELFPVSIPVIDAPTMLHNNAATSDYVHQQIVLTKRQCFAIHSSAFLCMFPTHWPSRKRFQDSLLGVQLPINFDAMHYARIRSGENSAIVAKLLMHLEYMHELSERVQRNAADLDSPASALIFARRSHVATTTEAEKFALRLQKCYVHLLKESIDDQKDMLRVDFANCCIGGGALSGGCVQEEIMFSICPELVVSILLFPPMQKNESIVILRSEQFSCVAPGTYGWSLEFGGRYVDRHVASSAVTCIDAVEFGWGISPMDQYESSFIAREVFKAKVGFDFNHSEFLPADATPFQREALSSVVLPSKIATGNWGCGAFHGDPKLKIVLQWIAASMAQREMHYYPFDNESLLQFQWISDALVAKGVTCLSVYDCLCRKAVSVSSSSDIFTLIVGEFQLRKRGG